MLLLRLTTYNIIGIHDGQIFETIFKVLTPVEFRTYLYLGTRKKNLFGLIHYNNFYNAEMVQKLWGAKSPKMDKGKGWLCNIFAE